MLRRHLIRFLLPLVVFPVVGRTQDSTAKHDHAMAGMPMDAQDSPTAQGVNAQMEGAMMDSPHMKMTAHEAPQAGDEARADSILTQLRASIARYQDYNAALADGFHIFLPNVKQKVYHFTNMHSAIYSAFTFDPKIPTSLLYEKTAGGYKLVGAMYTASRSSSLADLNARVPLSIGQWHEHVNICVPPKGESQRRAETENGKMKFGTKGSITTQAECDAAGGRFFPVLFGWMLHVNPYESDAKLVWGTHKHGEHGRSE